MQSQLDKAQTAMTLKAHNLNMPLTFAIKDITLDLRAHVEFARSEVRIRPAGANDAEASVFHLVFAPHLDRAHPARDHQVHHGGPVAQAALTAAHMAFLGHRGDPAVFDDPEFGYRRFIGSARWQPERLVGGIGRDWRFQRENSFKVYPHCRAPMASDLLTGILDENGIATSEIEAVRAWGEGHTERPCWTTKAIDDPVDAQFSTSHGLAVGAQRLPNSKVWQSPEVVFDPQVLGLMDKVSFHVHPDWASSIVNDPATRCRKRAAASGPDLTRSRKYP